MTISFAELSFFTLSLTSKLVIFFSLCQFDCRASKHQFISSPHVWRRTCFVVQPCQPALVLPEAVLKKESLVIVVGGHTRIISQLERCTSYTTEGAVVMRSPRSYSLTRTPTSRAQSPDFGVQLVIFFIKFLVQSYCLCLVNEHQWTFMPSVETS